MTCGDHVPEGAAAGGRTMPEAREQLPSNTVSGFSTTMSASMRPGIGPVGNQPSLQRRRRFAALMPRQLRRNQLPQADCHLLAFPGCGRTWLQEMMGRAIQLHYDLPPDDDVAELHHLADQARDIPCILAGPPGRPTLSHGGWRPGRGADRDRLVPTSAIVGELPVFEPVIVLVRDPRAVVDTWLNRGRNGRNGDEVEHGHQLRDLTDTPESLYEQLLAFYDLWVGELKAVPRARPILTVRYEDIQTDPGRELRRCLTFVGVIASEAVVAQAVELGSLHHRKAHQSAEADHRDMLDQTQIDRLTERMRASRAGHFRYH